jgi:hypothetical protein
MTPPTNLPPSSRAYRIVMIPVTFYRFAKYFRLSGDPRWLQQAVFYTKFTL